MATRYIDAINSSNTVIATYEETNDAIRRWNIPEIFPLLNPGESYNFVMRTPKTIEYQVPSSYLLDGFSLSSAVAFSFRQLNSSATFAARVRRSSDNALADIPFKVYPSRNYLYWIDEDALLDHCGSGSGFVETWYDQSGNNFHVTQSLTASQPRIVNEGVIERLNDLPAMWCNGTNNRLFRASAINMWPVSTAFFVTNQSGILNDRGILAEDDSTAGVASFGIGLGSASNRRLRVGVRNDADAPAIVLLDISPPLGNSVSEVLVSRLSGTSGQGFLNGTPGNAVNYTPSGTYTFNSFHFPGNANKFNSTSPAPVGHYAEGIVFLSNFSNFDMNTIALNQGEAYNISVVPFLTPLEQLAVINGTGDGGSSFAVGLSGVTDYSEPVFMNRAKQARGWLRPDFSGSTPTANLDNERALASLPEGDTTQIFFFNSLGNDPESLNSGRFRMTFTGSATLVGAGTTNLTQLDSNTYEFDCDWIGNKYFIFTPTSFPIKVSIVKTTDLAAHSAGAIFRQEWLDHIPSGGCLRFMDWHFTNNSPVVNLTDYPVETSQTWNRVPLSVIINLCNLKSVDPWINIPHQASDTLVTAWAEELRDNLDPDLLIRVELSNEIWNTGTFTQGAHFKALAESEWGVPDGFASGTWLARAGKRFVQIMQIFNAVFAGQTHRICGVLAGQAGNPGLASSILDASQWQTYEPGSYVAPRTLAKEWSIAPYINWVGNTTTTGNAIKAALDISQADAVAAIKGLIPASLSQAQGWIDAHVPVASSRGLRLTVYEYNNHYDLANVGIAASALYSGGAPVAGALDAFIEATYSQEMADAQDDLRAYFRSQNGSLMAFFVDMTRATRFGTWGAKTHLGHESLIWNALLAYTAANPRNWDQ